MATRRTNTRPTLTEVARRRQLIEVTVDLVADEGYRGASLAAIAARAGITKAAVLYHFRTKDEVVRGAYEHVLHALVAEVGAAVEAAPPADAPAAYVRSMIGHLREHPRHTRMIIESMTGGEQEHGTAERWRPLADLITAAAQARRTPGRPDARTLAIIVGGGIDGIVTEQLADPGYDSAAAAEELAGLLRARLEA